jgi:porin
VARRRAWTRSIALAALIVSTRPVGASNQTPWMQPQSDHPSPWGLMDFDRARGSSSAWDRPHSLTGDWGGWRSELEDEYGIFLFGNYTAEVAGNPVGGITQGIKYTHNIGLAFLVDLDTLAGIPHTTFIASASNREGSSLSKENIGNVYAVQQIYGGQTTRLVLLALGTELLDGTLDVVAGRLNGLDDFVASPLYCNAQNLAFCGNPLSIPVDVNISSYPNTAWGARVSWSPVKAFYAMGGTYNTRTDFRQNKFHGVDFSIHPDSGVIGIGEVGVHPHNIGPDGLFTSLPGDYKVGGYWDTEPVTVFSTGERDRGTGGFYLAFDQMLWREPDSTPDQGIYQWFAFHWAPSERNPQDRFFTWGLVYPGMIPGRDTDVFGIYGAYGHFSPAQRRAQEAANQPGQVYEMVLEVNYRINVLPWFYIQPDIQGIINPGAAGKIDDALVLAMQFGVPF